MRAFFRPPLALLVPLLLAFAPRPAAGDADLWIDRNSDGVPDYLVRTDGSSRKLYEEFDYNYDGKMDDFYYYQIGKLIRHEADTNYDGRVDLWVFLVDGVYIQGFERDTDFDGTVDVVRKFGRGV